MKPNFALSRKQIALSIALTLMTSSLLLAQVGRVISFEDTTNYHLLKIDTTLPNNIWQIGSPKKSFLNSGYLSQNAIITDTLNPYPINNYSAFTVTIPEEAVGNADYTTFGFNHKYDTDSLLDGGTIDVSYNGGQTWLSLFIDSSYGNNFYRDDFGILKTLGRQGFSGMLYSTSSANEWENVYTLWNWKNSVLPLPPDILICFVFASDSIQTNKEGWLIDNIGYGTGILISVEEQISIEQHYEVYPNPFKETLIIKSEKELKFSYSMNDLQGKEIIPLKTAIKEEVIDIHDLANGIYLLTITAGQNTFTKKVIKN